jgi:hypothetical protein
LRLEAKEAWSTFNQACEEAATLQRTWKRTKTSTIEYLIETKGGLDNTTVLTLSTDDSSKCTHPKRRSCKFMIAAVLSVFLADPGEHTYAQLGEMCKCCAQDNALRRTIQAFVDFKFLSRRIYSSRGGLHLYRMDRDFEESMPTNFAGDNETDRPPRSHNVEHLAEIKEQYKVDVYRTDSGMMSRRPPPVVSPAPKHTRSRWSHQTSNSTRSSTEGGPLV